MNVNPGELNKKIKIIEMLEDEKNENGFPIRKEKVVKQTKSSMKRISIKEAMHAGREMNITNCRFLIRYTRKKIKQGMFVLYKGAYYKIVYVNNYGDSNEYIEIMTEMGEP